MPGKLSQITGISTLRKVHGWGSDARPTLPSVEALGEEVPDVDPELASAVTLAHPVSRPPTPEQPEPLEELYPGAEAVLGSH